MKRLIFVFSLFLLRSISSLSQTHTKSEPLAHTYSIVARDEVTGEMAVAVQSHWFSVGTVVSWAEAGVGAIATQSFVNKSFGPRGLTMLKAGLTAREVLDSLLSSDEGRDVRQLAIVDSKGNVAVHTGSKCIDFASHQMGKSYSTQANMMLNSTVPDAMSQAFQKNADKPLGERMILALEAGEAAGGDIRGRQSAALIVVPAKSDGKPWDERTVDLRLDDHPEPIRELRRLYFVHLAYQHMNNGDLAIEKNDMKLAMKEYNAAMKLMPSNLEMQFWTGITLANNKQMDQALPILQKVFRQNGQWRELTSRLPKVNLLTISEQELKKILALK